MEYSPAQKRTALFIALALAATALVDYFLTEDNGIAFLNMLAVFSTLALPGRRSSVLVAAAAGLLALSVGYLKIPRLDFEHLLSERFFVLLSLALTLGLVLLLKKAEQERLEVSAQFATLFDQISEGILLVGMDGRIERGNKAAGRVFACDPETLAGQIVENFIPERFAKSHVGLRQAYTQKPAARQMGKGRELFARRSDGSEFPVEISLSPMESGGKRYVIVFLIDITERKAYENSLLRQKNELENLAIRLRESNSDLEKFAYVASHDLQEPLRKILTFSNLLVSKEKERLSREGSEMLGRVQDGAARMQMLVQDLLAYSRLNTRPPELQEVNLREVLDEALADLEISRRESGAEIRIGELPTLHADRTQMRQMFQNLLSNALKFQRPDTPPLVEIFAEKIENQSFVKIHVRDNGIGFDEKFANEIFVVFQRLHGQKFPGTGVGLAICKKIAQRHGGDVTASSRVGKGSDFVVTLEIKKPTN